MKIQRSMFLGVLVLGLCSGCLSFNVDSKTYTCETSDDCAGNRVCQAYPADPSISVCMPETAETSSGGDVFQPDTNMGDDTNTLSDTEDTSIDPDGGPGDTIFGNECTEPSDCEVPGADNVDRFACFDGFCFIDTCSAFYDSPTYTSYYIDCDGFYANGCEVEPVDGNCGGCGVSCTDIHPEGQCFEVGGCFAPGCDPDQGCMCLPGMLEDCDNNPATGCEADVLHDAFNCGVCGNACQAGEICDGGSCTSGSVNCELDVPGFLECDNDPITICETPNDEFNCGACNVQCTEDETCINDRCENAPPSCREILASDSGAFSRVYPTRPDGINTVHVYCDMDTAGGGWTRIFHMDTTGLTSVPPPGSGELFFELGQAASGVGGIHGFMNFGEYSNMIGGYLELRFECFKPDVNRGVHITTTDSTVIAHFLDPMGTFPMAPGSFTTLPGNDSTLSLNPDMWGFVGPIQAIGSWGYEMAVSDFGLAERPFFIDGANEWNATGTRMNCDDAGSTVDGVWFIYVR